MPFISTSFSSRFHYRKMGKGPVAVLIHGFPESGTLWRHTWDELSARYTLLIPDLPGAGESSLDKPASIADMAEAIREMLDAEQVKQAVIVGHSMGGYVGFAFADMCPQYMMGLTLVHSLPSSDDEEKKKTRKKVIDFVNKGHKDAFLKEMVPGLFAEGYRERERLKVEEQVTNALPMTTDALVNFYTAMMERPARLHVLDKAEWPLQWVIGVKDSLMAPAKLLSYAHTAPVNFISYYPDCGHMSMVEAPEKLATDINNFLGYCYRHEQVG